MKMIGERLRAAWRSRSSRAAATASSSTGVRTVPSASVRSSTSSRRSRSAIGRNSPQRPQVCGRSRRRISSTSRKPLVVITPMRGPLAVPTACWCRPWCHARSSRSSRCAPKRLQALREARRLVAAVATALWRWEAARRLVETKQIGEGAADVDADDRRAALRSLMRAPPGAARGPGAVDFALRRRERRRNPRRAASAET